MHSKTSIHISWESLLVSTCRRRRACSWYSIKRTESGHCSNSQRGSREKPCAISSHGYYNVLSVGGHGLAAWAIFINPILPMQFEFMSIRMNLLCMCMQLIQIHVPLQTYAYSWYLRYGICNIRGFTKFLPIQKVRYVSTIIISVGKVSKFGHAVMCPLRGFESSNV